MTYSHERIINEWLSSTMGADTVSVRFSYDYIEVYEFNGTLEQWIEVIKDQRQVWQDGEPVLKMESDWCSYARDALHLVPDHIKSELCKLHPDIEQAAACAK